MQHDSPNGAVTYCTSRKFQVYIRISNLHVIMIYRDIDVMPIVICDMKKFHIVAALVSTKLVFSIWVGIVPIFSIERGCNIVCSIM